MEPFKHLHFVNLITIILPSVTFWRKPLQTSDRRRTYRQSVVETRPVFLAVFRSRDRTVT